MAPTTIIRKLDSWEELPHVCKDNVPLEALGEVKSDNTGSVMRMFAVVPFAHLLFGYACPELIRDARCGADPLKEVVRDLPYLAEASVENSHA